jgi:RNA polymerase sigma-70 factor (ECF subfamily)
MRPRSASNWSERMTHVAQETDERTDLDLIARWRGGDQRAATLLVERHAASLARFASSLGARRDVEEVVQDTFVRAFASIDHFRGESSLRTWLFTILRRQVLDRSRSERRRGEQVQVQESDAATEFDSLDAVVADETRQRLQTAMERLTRTQREVFVLRVSEGLSYREIAEVAETTEGAARVHYHNAMRSIKEFLDE